MHKDKNSHSGPYTGQPLREKVHIWLGSLHAASFICCLCDDSLFVYQKILCVYVLEKVKTIFHFLVIHQQSLMKSIFVENGCILGKSTKGAKVFFYPGGTFWTPADLQKS